MECKGEIIMDNGKWGRGDTRALCILFLAIFILFLPVLAGWRGIFHDDMAMAEFPWHYFVARHLQQGVIPLWEPDTWCGAIPFYARYYADTTYFPLWPFLLLSDLNDLTQAFWMLSLLPLLLHYWLAAAGMYIFAKRSLRLHILPSFLTAWVYIFSPLFAYKYVAFPIVVVQAWLPWALILVVSMNRRPGFMKIVGLGVIIALMFLAAQPPHLGYSILIALVLAISLSSRNYLKKRRSLAWKGFLFFLIALGAGFLLAAVYILPVVEGMKYTRQHLSFTYRDMTGGDGSMPPVYLATLFIPDLFGTVSGFNNRNWVGKIAHEVRFWDANMSGGLLLTFLVLVALLLSRRRAREIMGLRFWVFLAVGLWLFSILCMMGRHTPFYYIFYRVVPVLSDFPFPIRYGMIQGVATAWLAGLGLELLVIRNPVKTFPRPGLVWGYVSLAGLAAILALFGKGGLRQLAKGNFIVPGLNAIISRGNLDWFLSHPVLYFFAAGFVLLLTWRAFRGRQRIKAVVSLVMLETAFFTFSAFYLCIFRLHEPQPQQLRSMGPQTHPMIRRVSDLFFNLEEESSFRWGTDQPFHDNFSRLDTTGCYAFLGYDMKPLEIRFKRAFEYAYGRPVGWPIYLEFPRPRHPEFLSNMSVAYLLESRSDSLFPGGRSKRIASDPDFFLHYNPDVLPRVYTLDRMVISSEEEALDELVKGDLRAAIFIADSEIHSINNGEPAGLSDNQPSFTDYGLFSPGTREKYKAYFQKLQNDNPVSRIDFSNPNRVDVEIEINRPAMLVFTEVWYPGWKAKVDGKPVPLLRVNYLQRAVWLEEGGHKVTLSFSPSSWIVGAGISLVCWGLVIIFAVGYWIRRYRFKSLTS